MGEHWGSGTEDDPQPTTKRGCIAAALLVVMFGATLTALELFARYWPAIRALREAIRRSARRSSPASWSGPDVLRTVIKQTTPPPVDSQCPRITFIYAEDDA